MIVMLPLISKVLTGTPADSQYEAPEKTRTLIKRAVACNTSGTDRTVTVAIVRGGASYTLISARNVKAGKTVDLHEVVNQVLEPGDSIQASASAPSAITLLAAGVESRA